ncbi:hypothetical protein C8F04DRAFT_1041841 [Mycena alexandri]|uniref:Uncharacterized protein n=1 Tax=Mycena alexandri TaxID=1745969 RepID=A0AAD6SRD0_9AGAR|nr:hypothetical protein C8F04DRAFT_1041841 [Mycena alexandri]
MQMPAAGAPANANANGNPAPGNNANAAPGANANANANAAGGFEFPGFAGPLHFHGIPRPDAPPMPAQGMGAQQEPAEPQPPLEWAPPPAPGPTLRDRVERREREAGLRCDDASCGVGPSDEEPFVEVDVKGEGGRRISLAVLPIGCGGEKEKEGEGEGANGKDGKACAHTFHPSCLVSAQRARRGWREPDADGEGVVEVVCTLCRVDGGVPREEWLRGSILPLD